MNHQWYCQVEGKVYGPIDARMLQQWVQDGRLTPNDLVRKGEGQWALAKDVKGIVWPAAAPPVEMPAELAEPAEMPWEQPNADVPPVGVSAARTFADDRPIKTKKLGKAPLRWLDIFDWRFEYYLTPWIIRVLWVVFLLLIAFMIIMHTIGLATSLLETPPPPLYLLPWLKILFYVRSVAGSIVSVLVVRVLLEMFLFIFHIAEDIGTLKNKLAGEGTK
jgi:hypothetical protein